jgi:uncharacterized protein (TIGR02147 family)
MRIFEAKSYKDFLRTRISTMPHRGRGELLKLSEAVRVHATRLSHILKGDMHFTPEQACLVAKHFGLSELETEFFLTLLQRERAGSKDLEVFFEKQLVQLRQKAQQLVHRVKRDRELSAQERAEFYSEWTYSAVRMLSSVKQYQSVDAIAEYLKLPREKIRRILDFLLATGLCIEADGTFKMGPQVTHLEANSPYAVRHHQNWRLKAMHRHEQLSARELAYTAPVSINARDQLVIRDMLMDTIQNFLKTVRQSSPEDKVACLTLDWFEF